MIKLFCGYDHREAVALYSFIQSVVARTTGPVSFIPLTGQQRDGTNAFTYERFLVPHLCGYEGWAVWADGDMTCLADISELWDRRDPGYAVQVVKHDYKTRYPIKYRGQPNRDYPRKNWSSLILWNCGHASNGVLSPQYVDRASGAELHRFAWLKDDEIGGLPAEWNWLALEQDYNPNAKLVHHTIGIPLDPLCRLDPWTKEWRENYRAAVRYDPQEGK